MNKSKSSPQLTSVGCPEMKKSVSLCDLQDVANKFYFEELFEGDGPLGIVFMEKEGTTVVKSITEMTVAAETYGLQNEMVLLEIDGETVSDYRHSMKRIHELWVTNSRLTLYFKRKIYPEVSKSLNEHNLFHYYDDFVDLGAKTLDDLKFVEYGDLMQMNMNSSEREMFKKINPMCESNDE